MREEKKKKEKPTISVIVPCFQVENYLENCINSILNQTYQDFEVLLVDDGSTDKTCAMCDFYANEYSNIAVIHKENGGLSDARNIGIDNAVGSYICFVDSDDTLHPDYLKILLNIIESTGADISVCSYQEVDNPYISNETIDEFSNVLYSREEAVRELILSDKLMNYAWNKLYKKTLFSNIRYPKGKRWEDIGATYKLFVESKKVAYTDKQLYYYLRREGSITFSKNILNSLDQFELLSQRVNDLRDDYPDLVNILETQLCVCSYNCWSFLVSYNEEFSVEIKRRIKECLAFLDKNGKRLLRIWTGLEEYKGKVKLFFRCKWLLRLIIKLKRIIHARGV